MYVEHDGTISIATGRSRKEKTWHNSDVQWSDFLDKLKETKRTKETYDAYKQMSKTDQDNMKDVGGFVGGTLKESKRRKGYVESRSVLTLDADHDEGELVEAMEVFYNFAYAIYSTHKHSKDNKRYRLVIPLARKVSPDEYAAIGRRLAEDINIEIFDDTTYEAERLMYWPSTSSDGDFEFYHNDGPWLDPDEWLAKYKDWRDVSEWPVSSRTQEVVKAQSDKQESPLIKDGVIGAFCRAYTIQDAIATFLNDIYKPAGGGRYTYTKGSTAGGLVVYNDCFAYSHHSTDPAGGKLCNAFDLVRIHQFGEEDEGARAGTAPNKMPSFKAMMEFARKDSKVMKIMSDEQFEKVQEEFGGILEKQEDESFKLQMARKESGEVKQTIPNVVLVLQNDVNLKGKLAYNTFSGRLDIIGKVPWKRIGGPWNDADDAYMRYYLEKRYGLSDRKKIEDGIMVVARDNAYHPVREYLNGLKWDEKPRVEAIFIDYLGALDTPYTRTICRKIMVGAIARIFQPGIKFDAMVTIQGPQGIGKSTLVRMLGNGWYSDSVIDLGSKDAFMQLSGNWLIEFAEMDAMRKAEINAIKHFSSKVVDEFRPPFGKHTEAFPRQCVFFGTTNESQILRDKSGGRRFWIIEAGRKKAVKSVFKDLTQEEINQIWAEAKVLWDNGETLILSDDIEAEARELQEAYTEDDPRIGMIEDYLERPLPAGWYEMDIWGRRNYINGSLPVPGDKKFKRNKVCVMEIWEELFGGDSKAMTRMQINDMHEIMIRMPGWGKYTKKQRFKNYGVQRGYYRIGSEEDEERTATT